MPNQNDDAQNEDPRAGSSLVPMLVAGLILIVVGMIVVMAIT